MPGATIRVSDWVFNGENGPSPHTDTSPLMTVMPFRPFQGRAESCPETPRAVLLGSAERASGARAAREPMPVHRVWRMSGPGDVYTSKEARNKAENKAENLRKLYSDAAQGAAAAREAGRRAFV